jgi:hypothetical protein
MSPVLKFVLEARWERVGKPAEGWLWPAQTKTGHADVSTFKLRHKTAIKDSKVRPFVVYSARHTFLSRLGKSGCDAWTLARIAGHSNISISMRYVHPSSEAVHKAMTNLGGHNSRQKRENGRESVEREANLAADPERVNGEPGVIRTRDPLLRRQMLYPAELRAPLRLF